jgi:hypothetical protein
MRNFFLFSVIYLSVAVAVLTVLHDDLPQVVAAAAGSTRALVLAFASLGRAVVIPLVIALLVMMAMPALRRHLPDIGLALLGSVLLQVAFSLIKTSIPLVVPFYADAPLAALDAWMHAGQDPWAMLHDSSVAVSALWAERIYTLYWVYPALLFPLFLVVADRDEERRRRYLLLYAGSWVVIGNLIALAGSSVGPVYHDALLGGDRFAALAGALDSSGIADSRIGTLQTLLWEARKTGGIQLGTGISAFPSMHVAIAAIMGLYMAERSRWLILPGLVCVLSVLHLSVFTGYHYAVDGYASVLLVALAAWALRRSPQPRLSGVALGPFRLPGAAPQLRAAPPRSD